MSSDNGLPAIHPGAFIEEIIEDLGISQAQFAKALNVSHMQVSHIVNGSSSITADMALRLGKALQQSPRDWLNLQADFDIKYAEKESGQGLAQVNPIAA